MNTEILDNLDSLVVQQRDKGYSISLVLYVCQEECNIDVHEDTNRSLYYYDDDN